MKTKLSIFLLSLIPFFFIACNDEELEPLDPSLSTFSREAEGYRVDFHLENARGERTVLFREDEDIIFNVTATNISGERASENELFDHNLFRVFSADGDKDFGIPWDNSDVYYPALNRLLVVGKSHTYQASWNGNTDYFKGDYYHPSKHKKLPSGAYYTIAPITFKRNKLEDVVITCKIYFNVVK